MSTLKVDSITNNGSAVDLTNGAFQIGGNSIVQGYTESATEPSNPIKGDLWWDTANEVLYQYLNGQFRLINFAQGGGATDWTVDLANVTYDNVSFSVAGRDTTPTALLFNPDGTKVYTVGGGSDTVYQHTLATGFDLSTASYDNVSFNVSGQETGPAGVVLNTDGTKMFIIGYGSGSVHQYTLSTGFDLSTASYANVSFSVAGQDTGPTGVVFNTDGTKMYMVGYGFGRAFQYSLSTAFDLSTASYDNVSFSVAGQDNTPFDVRFNPSGNKMYVAGFSSNTVHQYTLSTGFDLSTASYDSVSFSVAGQSSSPVGISFSIDGTKMYMVGSAGYGNDFIHQYSTGL
jgi:DNA-binding beta-propeller fold protein YncE